MEFEENPFWLYPVKGSQIDNLFIDRKEKTNKIERILNTEFKNVRIVCSVLSGIGIGKSSMLRYVKKKAERNDFKVGFLNNSSNILSDAEDFISKHEVALIDDVNKLIDDDARKFYNLMESLLDEVTFLFFSDRLNRGQEVEKLRDFTTSESVVLSKKMSDEKLRHFLTQRMENCYTGKEPFENPFEDDALQKACDRARGNLRAFFKYCQGAWFNRETEEATVGTKEMQQAIMNVDVKKLSSLDRTDYRILWFSTVGDINRSYLAKKCNIHRRTLHNRLQGRLKDLISVEGFGQETGRATRVSSIFKDLSGGKEQLIDVFKKLGVDLEEVRE